MRSFRSKTNARKPGHRAASNILHRLASRYFNSASKAFGEGQVIKSIRFYTDCLRIEPKNAQARYNRALAFSKVHETQKALTDFDKAILLNPYYSDAFNNRGVLYRRLGEEEKALADFNQAILLAPNFVGAYFNRGAFQFSKGDFQLAFDDYSSAIEKGRNTADHRQAYDDQMRSRALVARGVIYRKRGFILKATADYEESIRINPKFADAYIALANVLSLKGQFKRAIDLNTRAIQLTQDNYLPYMNRGLAFMKTKNYRKAIEDFSKVIALDGKEVVSAYRYRGAAYHRLGIKLPALNDQKKFEELIKRKH